MPNLVRRITTGVEVFFQRNVVQRLLMKRSLDQIFYILFGPIYFQAMSAAIRFDLFTMLSKKQPMTITEIAQALGVERKPARVLVSTLAGTGLLRQRGTRNGEACYKNSMMANLYLTKDKELNAIPIVEWYHHIVYNSMYYFYDSIKENRNVGLQVFEGTEKTLYQRLTHVPELEQIFQDAMQQISAQANTLLARYVDFSAVKHVVDFGGGNGSNLIAIARGNPHLKATVFDLPPIKSIAESNIASHGLSDRIGVVSGNCFDDPFPDQVDCVLFCHFLDIWSEDQNRELIKKAFDSLSSGGRIIVFDIMENSDKPGPLTAVAGSPYFLTLATGDGYIYNPDEYKTWMAEAGFSTISEKLLPQDHVAVIGVK